MMSLYHVDVLIYEKKIKSNHRMSTKLSYLLQLNRYTPINQMIAFIFNYYKLVGYKNDNHHALPSVEMNRGKIVNESICFV